MPAFSGNCTSNNTSQFYTIPMKIVSFSLTNKTGGAGNATVGIIFGSTFDILYNRPLAAAGSSGCEYIYPGWPITLPPNNRIFISASVSTDFYFSIEPL